MSFLYRASPMLRTVTRPSPRLFSTAVVYRKTATDTVKDGLKAVDRTVSDAAVKGIDTGVEMKNKAAEVAGMESSKAASQASGKSSEVQGKASELAGEAKGKAEELKGQAKGKVEEVKGKM